MSTDLQTQINLLYKRVGALEDKVSSLQSSPSPPPPGGSKAIWELTKKKEIREEMADELLKHRGEAAGGVFHWDNEDKRQQYIKLKAEIKALNAQLAAL